MTDQLQTRLTPLERAFELARTGRYGTMGQIANALAKEGYTIDERRQLFGTTLSRQLRDICRSARNSDLSPTLSGGPGERI